MQYYGFIFCTRYFIFYARSNSYKICFCFKGFLSTSRKELPGNAGLFDITASLHWVRRYIQFFGGDPDRIIPSGQGSGASAAVMLTLTHFTKGNNQPTASVVVLLW